MVIASCFHHVPSSQFSYEAKSEFYLLKMGLFRHSKCSHFWHAVCNFVFEMDFSWWNPNLQCDRKRLLKKKSPYTLGSFLLAGLNKLLQLLKAVPFPRKKVVFIFLFLQSYLVNYLVRIQMTTPLLLQHANFTEGPVWCGESQIKQLFALWCFLLHIFGVRSVPGSPPHCYR